MQRIQHYQPPTTEDLAQLKAQLKAAGMKATADEMASLAGLSDGRQWRKYTGGAQPRELGAQMLFFIAARLTLPEDQLEPIYAKMREIGATLDLEG
ncbi:XRE family transcriptional regulator [Pseudomonas oryzihabitans]|uniref:XRE family transcriptional regulator n=1 Tax=Pseudomonas oryzihabitans TaxID=47885 RepID=UPI0011A822D4|nr:XRE family transcriptional regulator [Pseudomonas psychrotolerans]